MWSNVNCGRFWCFFFRFFFLFIRFPFRRMDLVSIGRHSFRRVETLSGAYEWVIKRGSVEEKDEKEERRNRYIFVSLVKFQIIRRRWPPSTSHTHTHARTHVYATYTHTHTRILSKGTRRATKSPAEQQQQNIVQKTQHNNNNDNVHHRIRVAARARVLAAFTFAHVYSRVFIRSQS